ncbi:MAG: KH domain-containing protein [Verrucomicrobiota bacterium]
MPKRPSKIASSLKQLGDIQVNDWDFMALLNTDIQELEIAQSLRRLGEIRVTDWDFKDVVPAVKKVANQEVDVIDILKRTANYKVMEWDFKSPAESVANPEETLAAAKTPSREEMQEITLRLKNFLQFVVVNLIDEPNHAQIKVAPLEPSGLRFKLVLTKKDVSMLIGREGLTAAAIRGLLKSAAQSYGVQALLQIHSHEEEGLLAEEERD